VSFAFNVGAHALEESTLLILLNEGKAAEAGEQFERWNHADGKVVAGLTKRREAERELFISGSTGI
jgi:GH24 family phage-related lysozyme (muramidase)